LPRAAKPDANALPSAVFALGLVSFFTDLSSEMIYPLLPVFLAGTLGAGMLSLGLIEGVAEATASLLKVVSGLWSDRVRRRKPLVLAGYTLSGSVRPLIGLATAWPHVLLLRFSDRVGKGLRTSPRDALIADVTPAALRGRAYGLHRAMDHAGAVAGPLVAAGLLTLALLPLRQVFLWAAAPALLVVLILVFGVRENATSTPSERSPSAPRVDSWRAPGSSRPFGAPLDEAIGLGEDYRRLLLALLVFTLGNSTDAFLLLRLSHVGIAAHGVALLWSLHHLVKVVATYLGGRLCDRVGRQRLVLAGWLVYGGVYLAFALAEGRAGLIAAFLIYGVYFGLTEPAEKAWVADLAPAGLRGTAFGTYHATLGLAALPASLLVGLLWQARGAPLAFGAGAALAVVAALLLLRVRDRSGS
jgi:MFS family permease